MRQLANTISALYLATMPTQALALEELKLDNNFFPKHPSILRIAADLRNEIPKSSIDPVQLNAAIFKFKIAVLEIYKSNGKENNSIESSSSRLSVALEDLCSKLDLSFNRSEFKKKTIINQCEFANSLLQKFNFVVVDLDFKAYGKNLQRASISFNLEEVFKEEEIDCSKIDFSIIGASKNPLPAKIKFLESRTIIPGSGSETPCLPITCLMLSQTSKQFAILYGHDFLHSYLEKYSAQKSETVDPDLKNYLVNWGLGRLAYHLSIAEGSNKLPEGINLFGNPIGLRNSMGLYYALEQQKDFSPEMACVTISFLSLNSKNPDCMHAAILSQNAINDIKKQYPEIQNLYTFRNLLDFFSRNNDAANDYLHSLKTKLGNVVNEIKLETESQNNKKAHKLEI